VILFIAHLVSSVLYHTVRRKKKCIYEQSEDASSTEEPILLRIQLNDGSDESQTLLSWDREANEAFDFPSSLCLER
jgi:hypothetical protein